jgi:hypothetical protein
VGFEPTNPRGLAVFKTAALSHSATHPHRRDIELSRPGEEQKRDTHPARPPYKTTDHSRVSCHHIPSSRTRCNHRQQQAQVRKGHRLLLQKSHTVGCSSAEISPFWDTSSSHSAHPRVCPWHYEGFAHRVAVRCYLSWLAGSELRVVPCAVAMLACSVVDPRRETG